MSKKNSQKVKVPGDETHKALLSGFRAILRKTYPTYNYKLYHHMNRGWTVAVIHPRVAGDCILYIEGDKLIVGINKKTVLDLNDPEMDKAVAPAVHAAFNPPLGSRWNGSV